ncbi:cupredoxin domain-containing protein [Sporichthya sp.]|uniref:cupredoxin domain-containing protein n=1 Tax=Sporichthya sp. TaxID=65475 RepID=UPI0017975442|nr:cupredoxin domain-containing protein [Sporichthya sp.]MBA3742603.1 cupredoxin domain-containing protein [Sporichthya sp.]
MTSRRSFLFGAGGVIALGALAACGDGPPGASGAAPAADGQSPEVPTNTIVIKNFVFSPATLTVAPGAVVMVNNQDTAPHTATAEDRSFDTGNLAGNQRGSITAPTEPGEYPYICDIHQYMKGNLTVKAS